MFLCLFLLSTDTDTLLSPLLSLLSFSLSVVEVLKIYADVALRLHPAASIRTLQKAIQKIQLTEGLILSMRMLSNFFLLPTYTHAHTPTRSHAAHNHTPTRPHAIHIHTPIHTHTHTHRAHHAASWAAAEGVHRRYPLLCCAPLCRRSCVPNRQKVPYFTNKPHTCRQHTYTRTHAHTQTPYRSSDHTSAWASQRRRFSSSSTMAHVSISG